jgi:hypothetical protein
VVQPAVVRAVQVAQAALALEVLAPVVLVRVVPVQVVLALAARGPALRRSVGQRAAVRTVPAVVQVVQVVPGDRGLVATRPLAALFRQASVQRVRLTDLVGQPRAVPRRQVRAVHP